ncbi:hypothetical protein LIER_40995 [Lithospermum erythrorhizon]|uniref:Uncharacterized protein n=1 Tax=Lithospermum erythrorhizon TaxID=34254 RepID=A0AAV3R2V6_LITER
MLSFLNNFRRPGGWNEEKQLAIAIYKGKSFRRRLQKLYLSCVVYETRSRVRSWKIVYNKANWEICVNWGFPLDIMV